MEFMDISYIIRSKNMFQSLTDFDSFMFPFPDCLESGSPSDII
jgi:hypothetical protein